MDKDLVVYNKIFDIGNSELIKQMFIYHNLGATYIGISRRSKISYDITNQDDIPRLVEFLKENYNPQTDLLVFSAGVLVPDRIPFYAMEDDQLLNTLEVNALSTFKILRSLLSISKAYRLLNHHILVINSVASQGTYPNHLDYSSSKYLLDGLIKNINSDLKNEGSDTKILQVYPPQFASKLSSHRGEPINLTAKRIFEIINSNILNPTINKNKLN